MKTINELKENFSLEVISLARGANYYLAINDALRKVEFLGWRYDFADNTIQYSFADCESGSPYFFADQDELRSLLYVTEQGYISGEHGFCLYTIIKENFHSIGACGKHHYGVINYYYVANGLLRQVCDLEPYALTDLGFLFAEIDENTELYRDREDALALNVVRVVDENGEHTIGGTWMNVQPTEEQIALIEEMMSAIKRVEESGIFIAYDRDCERLDFIRNGQVEYDGDAYAMQKEGKGKLLLGWSTYSKPLSLYNYNGEDCYYVVEKTNEK